LVIIGIQKRRDIVQLNQSGVNGREIARRLRMSRGAVQKLLKTHTHKSGDDIEHLPQTGRLRSKKYPMKTARQLVIDTDLSGIAYIDTVKRELRRGGLFGRIAMKKPYLSGAHTKKRKAWCLERK
jgi:biotin operon repressor